MFLGQLFMNIIYQPFLNVLVFFYWLDGIITRGHPDMGVAVILLTIIIRILLLPMSLAEDKSEDHFSPTGHAGRAGSICRALMKSEYDFTKAKRGAVVATPPGKTRITIRLDNGVLDWFRKQVNDAGGGNYQALINDALLEHVARRREPLESTIRRVIREELRRTG